MAEDGNLLPRFFKVFLSETTSESMAIPMSFNEHLEDPLPKTAKLQGTGGRTWTVSLNKIRERVYFTVGWSIFAGDNELKDGEFLTFVYDGYRTFEVSVFGRSGCKETRAVVQTIDLSDSDSYEEEEDNVMDVDEDSSFGEDEEISQSIYPVDSEETETEAAVVVESSNLEVMANPCFETNLKNRIYELLIPANVVKDHGLRFDEYIKYIDEEGIIVGKRGKWADDRICFKGWDKICRRNRLKEDHIVKCELLHNRYLVHSIKIHITRR